MTSLKLDFNQRITCDLNNNIFSNFNNQDYRLKDITFYYFYVISKIKKNSNTVVLCCNPSIESHILSFFLVNCGSYQYSSYHDVKSVLAVTEKGDTIAVPLREFERNKYESYTRFNWNNQWYWNNWRYSYNLGFNNWWHWNNPYWGNNTIIIPRQTRIRPNVQPRNTPPRTRPR